MPAPTLCILLLDEDQTSGAPCIAPSVESGPDPAGPGYGLFPLEEGSVYGGIIPSGTGPPSGQATIPASPVLPLPSPYLLHKQSQPFRGSCCPGQQQRRWGLMKPYLRAVALTERTEEPRVWSPHAPLLEVALHWFLLSVNTHQGFAHAVGTRTPSPLI